MINAHINLGKLDYEGDINKWCHITFGGMAADLDSITKEKRWAYRQAFGEYIYYFANEPDAVLFALKWAS